MFDEEGNFVICSSSGKRCYSSKEADSVLSSVKRKHHGNRHTKIPKRKYYCDDCDSYHLTAMTWSRDSYQRDGRRKKRFIKTL